MVDSSYKNRRIPKWLCKRLSQDGLVRVESAIADAEKNTTGEIVVCIARRSSSVSHIIPFIAWCLTILFFELSIEYIETDIFLFLLIAMLSVAFAFVLSKTPVIQRMGISKNERVRQVENAAAAEFLRARISNTEAATGILIYISMMERRVVILGDSAIASKVQQSDWDGILSAVLHDITGKDLVNGLVVAIEKAGRLLAEKFPAEETNKNELSNHLRFLSD